MTQFGLATFTWQPGSQAYEARPFNFHLFPLPAGGDDMRFSCQASSLAFLAAHGFDFNKVCLLALLCVRIVRAFCLHCCMRLRCALYAPAHATLAHSFDFNRRAAFTRVCVCIMLALLSVCAGR